MRLKFLSLAFFISATLAAPGTRGKAIANYDIRNPNAGSHHDIFLEYGRWNRYSESDFLGSREHSSQKQKLVGRTIIGGVMEDPLPDDTPRYIYEDPAYICNWCDCPSTSMSNHACPADSNGYGCPKCSDECLNCSCGSSSDQSDHCSTECAKKCVNADICMQCSCASKASEASNPGKLCDPACHKCPVPGSDQPNQRCDLCPYLPCVDNLCPCFNWCRTGECNIYDETGKKSTAVCKDIAARCNGANYCLNLSEDSIYANNQPEFLSPYFNKVTAPAMTPQVNNADQLARVSNANQISVDESSQYLTPPTDINQASDPSVNNFDTIQPETAQAGDVFASGDGTDSLRTTGIGTEKEGARNVVYEDSAVNA